MPGAKLEVGGTVVRQKGEVFTFGRAADCDVALPVDLVSRYHAELRLVEGRWMVRDLDSANSTFLNRRRIDLADVRVGDVIRLGEGGPKVRIVELDPAPVDEEVDDDLQATRFVRVKAPRQPKAGERPRKRKKPKPKPEPKPRATPAAARAPFPWLGVVGAVFGVSVALAWWPEPFPYETVAAPGLWASLSLASVLPGRVGVLLVIVLAVYFGGVGVCAQRVRTFPLLILFGGAHVVAVLSL